MVRDKERIDRRREQRRDQQTRLCAQLARLIEAELGDDEFPGVPFRTGIGILVPIERKPSPEACSEPRAEAS